MAHSRIELPNAEIVERDHLIEQVVTVLCDLMEADIHLPQDARDVVAVWRLNLSLSGTGCMCFDLRVTDDIRACSLNALERILAVGPFSENCRIHGILVSCIEALSINETPNPPSGA